MQEFLVFLLRLRACPSLPGIWRRTWSILALGILLTTELEAQSNSETPTKRLDQIQAERLEKSNHIGLDRQSAAASNTFGQLGRFLRPLPISFEVGGLGPGAGPAIDSLIQKTTYNGHLQVRTWGHLAVHDFYTVGVGAEYRNFPAHELVITLEGSHADAPQLEYYGSGPNSSIHNRTNFRREDTLFDLQAGFHPYRNLFPACRFGQLLPHIGPGTNDDLAVTQAVFGPNEAPGIDTQSNYWIGGCSARFDLRDFPEDPHKGTFAEGVFDHYNDETHGHFSFNRLSLTGEQYLPFFNRKRVIAIRGKTDLSFHSHDQAVPFYLQPTLGSDEDLRGFRRYRFYDENSISLNAEYRWELSTGFDMALFIDGGKVFHTASQFGLSRMDSSAGFGFRFKNQSERKMIARLDIGFSREGFQIWLKTAKLF